MRASQLYFAAVSCKASVQFSSSSIVLANNVIWKVNKKGFWLLEDILRMNSCVSSLASWRSTDIKSEPYPSWAAVFWASTTSLLMSVDLFLTSAPIFFGLKGLIWMGVSEEQSWEAMSQTKSLVNSGGKFTM